MKVWMTIEPDEDEVKNLLYPEKGEGVSKTPLKTVIDHAYLIMDLGHEVSLKLTTMKRRGFD